MTIYLKGINHADMERLRILDREHFDAYVYLVGDTGGQA